MLVIKLELEKNSENFRGVMAALAEFDIAYASWETEDAPVEAKSGAFEAKSGASGDSLSSAVSDAVNSVQRRRSGR